MLEIIKNAKMSDESKERLMEIIQEMQEYNKGFFDCLSFQEEEKVNQCGLERALYLLTENDQIDDTGYYENESLPYYNECHHDELCQMIDREGIQVDLEIRASYYRYNPPTGMVVVQSTYSDGDWELEGGEALYSILDFESYEDAENLAKELNLDYFYYHNTLQLNYLVKLDDIENMIKEDEDMTEDIDYIIELIEKVDKLDIDEERFQEFKNNLMEYKEAI